MALFIGIISAIAGFLSGVYYTIGFASWVMRGCK